MLYFIVQVGYPVAHSSDAVLADWMAIAIGRDSYNPWLSRPQRAIALCMCGIGYLACLQWKGVFSLLAVTLLVFSKHVVPSMSNYHSSNTFSLLCLRNYCHCLPVLHLSPACMRYYRSWHHCVVLFAYGSTGVKVVGIDPWLCALSFNFLASGTAVANVCNIMHLGYMA